MLINSKKIKLFTILFLFVLSIFVLFSFIFFVNNSSPVTSDLSVYAENPEINFIDVGEDLFEQLLFIRDGQYPENLEEAKLFKDDFASITNLNLSNMYLDYVGGLAYFDFSELVSLNISNNSLTSIIGQTFINMPKLQILDISNNNITSINFGNLNSLQQLYAQNNKLTSIDLSILKTIDENKSLNVNLCSNSFTRIANIVLPTRSNDGIYVDLYNNSIIDAEYNSAQYAPHFLNFILLNIKGNESLDTKTKIIVYPSQSPHDYSVKFTNKITSEFIIIRNSNNTTLPQGSYYVEIYDLLNNLSTDEYSKNIYAKFEIKICKSAPIMNIYMDGKQITETEKINSPITLNFDSENDNYQTQYSINGGNFINSTSLLLSESGRYTIKVRSVNGDEISSVMLVDLELNIEKNNFWSFLIFFVCLGGLAVLFMLLKVWIK